MNPQLTHEDTQNHESFTPETLHQLKEEINSLALQEENAYESIQADFNEHMQAFSGVGLLEGEKGCRLSEFLLSVKERLQEKSRNMGCLAQLGLKMMDYFNEQRYRQSLLIGRFEETVQQLQQQNIHLSSKNVTIQNDVEYFRERLEATEVQLEKIVTQESEESAQEQLSSSNHESERDKQIHLLQKELQSIREEIQLYKQGNQRDSNRQSQDPHRFVRIRSQLSIFPEHPNGQVEAQLSQSKKKIEMLESQNIRLQRELDITQNKVRSRRSSRISVDVKENRHIELIPEQTAEQTQRKEELDQDAMDHSPSGFSLMQKGNLLGDIKQSLNSSNSNYEVSNRIICMSSNRSLFANLEMRDLVKDQEQYLRERKSMNCMASIEIEGEKRRERIDASVNTEFRSYCEKSTMTRQKTKPSLLKRLILLPVNILLRIIWRNQGYGMGCLG